MKIQNKYFVGHFCEKSLDVKTNNKNYIKNQNIATTVEVIFVIVCILNALDWSPPILMSFFAFGELVFFPLLLGLLDPLEPFPLDVVGALVLIVPPPLRDGALVLNVPSPLREGAFVLKDGFLVLKNLSLFILGYLFICLFSELINNAFFIDASAPDTIWIRATNINTNNALYFILFVFSLIRLGVKWRVCFERRVNVWGINTSITKQLSPISWLCRQLCKFEFTEFFAFGKNSNNLFLKWHQNPVFWMLMGLI